MNFQMIEHCKNKIQDLLSKKLIRPNKSFWSYAAFYVQKKVELERRVSRLVINCKPFNKSFQWIRYPIPNKKNLLSRVVEAKIFFKFDLKSRFWQI